MLFFQNVNQSNTYTFIYEYIHIQLSTILLHFLLQHKYVERFESKDPGARGAEGGAAAVLDLLSGGTTAGCDRLRCGVLHQTAVGTPERLSHGSKHR